MAQTYAETINEVRNAAVKLQRAVANGGVDPVSGYRDECIAAYLRAADETTRRKGSAAGVVREAIEEWLAAREGCG